MAATQKKTGGRTASSSGGRGSGKKTGNTRGKRAAPTPKPFRREIGAAVCLLLAFFAAIGYFRLDGVVINWFCILLKGLFGYGFWLATPALLLAAWILAFHRGRPVRLRTAFALLLPLTLGALLHLLLAGDMEFSQTTLQQLWESGQTLQSGGVLSGALAIGFIRAFSAIGAGVLLVVWALLMLMTALNLSPADIVDYFRSRPQYREEEPAAPRRKERETPQPAPVVQMRTRRSSIDIPVDDGPAETGAEESTPIQPDGPLPPPGKKPGFFNRKSSVPAPDQLLASKTAPEPEPQEAPEVSSEESVPPPQPIPEIVREPAVPKITAQEREQAAAEVARDIQENLSGQEGQPYQYPPLSLLDEGTGLDAGEALGELRANQQRLSDTIHSFGIEANIANVTRGPSVTRYELELDQGVRLNKLTNLADDIALALGATGVRIAPIPDKISMVGIEVPNKLVSTVPIHEVIGSKEFCEHRSKVAFAVGKNISGQCVVGDIAKLPHLLIAGTTGSGKSVCTNSLIVSLLYKATPEEVRLIMVDPKMVELSVYNGIPHLLIPVVTDPKKAAGALQWAVTEMMKRYRTFSEVGVRDLASYNRYAAKTEGVDKLPQVVVVIDELADLMLVAAKEVEESICRVAQMGRAAGMHLIIATQRPSADVITGLMKANIPSRIAFAVSSAMESRIILDTQGAEKLVGRGDMLYAPLGTGKPQRVQGCLISDKEVAAVVDFIKGSSDANYSDEVMHEIEQHAAEKDKGAKGGDAAAGEAAEDYDELLPSAIEVVVETGQASVSLLQRRLKLGYSRAARLVDQMEEKGIVGPFEGSKPRQLLITKEQWQEMKFRQNMDAGPAEAEPAPPEGPEDREEDAPPF